MPSAMTIVPRIIAVTRIRSRGSMVVVPLVLGLLTSCAWFPPPPNLRLMIISDLECGCQSADIYQSLSATLKRFTDQFGVDVDVVSSPKSTFEHRVALALLGEEPPDVVWVGPAALSSLASAGFLATLSEWTARRSEVVEDLPAWMREQFTVGTELYGVPIATEGEARLTAYAMTAAAVERGRAKFAFELIAHLRREIPRRDQPDVAAYSLDFPKGDGEQWQAGVPVIARAEIRNLGTASASNVMVEFRVDDGPAVVERVIGTLDTGDAQELEVDLGPLRPGLRQITVVADPGLSLQESNELNNLAIGTYKAGLSGPLPAPTSASTPFCLADKAYKTDAWGMGPKAAFDGTDYLVVWARQQTLNDTYNHELRVTRISTSGQVLDPSGVVLVPGPKKVNKWDVAFGGGTYLVVWEEDLAYFNWGSADPGGVIRGRLVTPTASGLQLGTPLTIDNSPTPATGGYPRVDHVAPEVFFDGKDFVVVYLTAIGKDVGTDQLSHMIAAQVGIYARRLSVTGQVQSSRTQLVAPSGTLSLSQYVRQRVDFAQGKALLAFLAFNPSTQEQGTYGSWITTAGTIAATPPQVIAKTTHPTQPQVIRSFENPVVAAGPPEHLVVWESDLAKPATDYDPDLQGALGKATAGAGGSMQTLGTLVKGAVERWPGVAHDGSNFALFQEHAIGCTTYLGGQWVSPNGQPGNPVVFKSQEFVSNIDVISGTTNSLVTFSRFNKPTTKNGPDFSWSICGLLVGKSP